jgi:hypothetical protein
MTFDEIVVRTVNGAPEGWKQNLTLDEYAVLEDDQKDYYKPVYASYKTKKRREYGDCEYGERHFLGWEEYRVGVGEPISWEYVGFFGAIEINHMLASNVLTSRMLASATGKGGPMTEDEAVKFNGMMNQ